MGKRSRKRTGASAGATTDAAPSGGSTRAERDAARSRRAAVAREQAAAPAGTRARQRRPGRDERPPAPWGTFPLVELCVLIAIVLLIVGFVSGGRRGATMIAMGLALGSLGGLELSIREHFAGYRSHTTLLAGAAAVVVGTLVAVVAGKILIPVLIGVGVAVFAASFYALRHVFRARTGGVSFR
ncbi:MAG: hypothetical protein QOI64_685 [Solirubrobacteraceae bacterium]|jgi:hypothetical protein|nr:hypothetical protein [Solirubrobacteraceae bacterium]